MKSGPKYEAKPSLSQRCDQSLQVSRSPNHWWASSCETRPSAFSSSSAISSWSIWSVIVVAVMFSMPPPNSGMQAWAYLAYGYGRPMARLKNAIIRGVLPMNRRAVASSTPRAT